MYTLSRSGYSIVVSETRKVSTYAMVIARTGKTEPGDRDIPIR
jgi:hypothetical protein